MVAFVESSVKSSAASLPSLGRPPKATSTDILRAAWALFETRGFDAVTMSEIAEQAGVSRRTLFNHFPHKVALLFEPIDGYVEQFRTELQQHDASAAPFGALTGTFWALAPSMLEALGAWNPGPEVLAARLREDAENFWKARWAQAMESVALDFLGAGKRVQAAFVGAITAQVWTEVARLQRESRSHTNVEETLAMVFGELDALLQQSPPSA